MTGVATEGHVCSWYCSWWRWPWDRWDSGIRRAKVPKYLGGVCLNVLNVLIAQRGVTHGL